MARAVRWSPEALDDLDEIAGSIARNAPLHANVVTARVFELANGLSELSERGRIVPELNRRDMREVFIYSYRIIYRVEEETVVIWSVVHGARLLDTTRPIP